MILGRQYNYSVKDVILTSKHTDAKTLYKYKFACVTFSLRTMFTRSFSMHIHLSLNPTANASFTYTLLLLPWCLQILKSTITQAAICFVFHFSHVIRFVRHNTFLVRYSTCLYYTIWILRGTLANLFVWYSTFFL